MLAEAVDVVPGGVVALGCEALCELRAGVSGGVHILGLAAAGSERENGEE